MDCYLCCWKGEQTDAERAQEQELKRLEALTPEARQAESEQAKAANDAQNEALAVAAERQDEQDFADMPDAIRDVFGFTNTPYEQVGRNAAPNRSAKPRTPPHGRGRIAGSDRHGSSARPRQQRRRPANPATPGISGAGLYNRRRCAIAKGYPNQNGAPMPSPNHIPDDAFPESAISPADLESPETPEADPQYLLVQSGFGLHVRLGKDGDRDCAARTKSPSWCDERCITERR